MLRTFNQHDLRVVDALDGRWDFVTEPERRDRRRRTPRVYPRTMHVPSCWENLPGLENYRGRAWFRTDVPTVEGMAVRLVFGGVSHTGTVYLDGRRAGSHYDAFTPWDVVVPSSATGLAELVVEVDNSFGEHSALHIDNDYYTYGGLTRPVEIQQVPPVYIANLRAVPERSGKTWRLDVAVDLHNWSAESQRRQLILTVGGAALDLGRVTVRAGSRRRVTGILDGLDVEPWTLDSPILHFVEAVLLEDGEPVDDYVDRIGFRAVAVRGKRLLLNGEPIRLRGYNRHEDHPQFGCAIPVEAMTADLEIMRDLGCNFVRTCHYPNDARFLDLCDELGMAVWEESHARTVDFKHPRFREQIADSTREMIDQHVNHPSILMWGCLNECDSISAAGRREYERVFKLMRKLDGSRPLTFASNHAEHDICLDLVDIVSWNRYDAWYTGRLEDLEPRLDAILKWLHGSPRSGGSGKPVIMSEFGAGAVYGTRQRQAAKWSEEYQREVLDESLRVYLNHPDVVGAAIWQFCDVRVTSGWWSKRPGTVNNKGTVDAYRRPKLCYDVVKQRMHEAMRSAPSAGRRGKRGQS